MGPFLEFRRWITQAPPAERLLAGVVGALVVALIGWAAVPAPGSSDASIASEESQTASVELATSTTPVAGGTKVAGSATKAASSGGHPGSSRGVQASGPAASAAKKAGPLEALRASDRGITAKEVKLGFVMMDVGGLRNSGFGVVNTRTDVPQVIDALVDWANKKGGVHGRKIVPVKKTVDLINQTDQRNKCLDFTQRDKVFAVVDSFTYVFPGTRACLTVENKTPYFTAFPGGLTEIAKAAPFQVSNSADSNNMLKNWVFGAKAQGFFDPKKGFGKLGILSDNCDRTVFDGPVGLKTYLKQAGVTSWSEFVSGCDITDQQAAGAPAVLQHRRDGVTHVLLTTFSVAAAAYTNAAGAQNWKPKYFAGDFGFISWDGSTPDFDPAQWDGARATTNTRTGELAAGKPLSPKAKECSKILTDRGLEPIKEYNRDYEAWLYCDHVQLFLKAANAAPRNLTRLDWGAAVQKVGEFESAFFNGVRFEPGVLAGGGRKLAVIEWRRSCACYHQIKGFGAAYR